MTTSIPTFSIRIRSGMAAIALLFGLLFSHATSAAEDPEIHVATGAEEIFVGESVDYQVEIRNVKNPPAPDLAAIKDEFEVIANGDESRDQQSISIINGRVSKQSILSHVYHYRLTPKTAGEQTIPAATVSIDGKVLTSSRIPLRVTAPEEQDVVLLEIHVSHAKVYPTQPFTVTLHVLIRPLPNNPAQDPVSPVRRQPPHLQINWVDPIPGLTTEDKSHWLQPLLADDGIGLTLNDVSTNSGSFFDGQRAAVFSLLKGREIRDGLDGNPVRYFHYELTRTFTPNTTGVFSFGPAVIKGTFVAGFERKEYTGRRLVATASPVSVDVREVPTPRPPTFCGGIGEYKVSASASPAKLRVGDPLTLTLDFERGNQSGSLELISAPDLSAIPQLVEDFDLIDTNPTGRIDGAKKKFAYAMRPKRSNVSIPSMKVSTFDPESEKFAAIETKPIPLEVSEADRLSSNDLVGNRALNGSTAIKTRSEGIFQNITDPREMRDDRVSIVAWFQTTLGAWIISACLCIAVILWRRRLSDAGLMRRQQARGTANRRLAEARGLADRGDSTESLRKVRSAIGGMVADLRNRVSEGLTTADIETILSDSKVADDDRTAILQLLESIESAEFGAGQITDPTNAIDSATKLIARIAPALERGINQ